MSLWVEITDLNFSYDNSNYLFKNFNLTLLENKCYVLSGLNGCGKSTLIKLVAGKMLASYDTIKVFKKDQRYLLIKNTKFNFLKNLTIFPMEELSKPKNFNENLNFKMSNMNMNIKIEYLKKNENFHSPHWIDEKKINSYMLPSFTKKIVRYLQKN